MAVLNGLFALARRHSRGRSMTFAARLRHEKLDAEMKTGARGAPAETIGLEQLRLTAGLNRVGFNRTGLNHAPRSDSPP
jgi:hypothetical protein